MVQSKASSQTTAVPAGGAEASFNPHLGKKFEGPELDHREQTAAGLIAATIEHGYATPDIFKGVTFFKGTVLKKISDFFVVGGTTLARYIVRIPEIDGAFYDNPFQYQIDSDEYNWYLNKHRIFTCVNENLSQASINPRDTVIVTFMNLETFSGPTIMWVENYKASLAGGTGTAANAGLPYRTKPIVSKKEIQKCKRDLPKKIAEHTKSANPSIWRRFLKTFTGSKTQNILGVFGDCMRKEIIKISRKGAKYSHGAAGLYSRDKYRTAGNMHPPRYDCSGIFYAVSFALGVEIPRTSTGMWKACSRTKIPENLAKKTEGTLLFFIDKKGSKVTHVEMSNGNGSTSASQNGSGVRHNIGWGWWKNQVGAAKKWSKIEYGILPHFCAAAKVIKSCPVPSGIIVARLAAKKTECDILEKEYKAKNWAAGTAEYKKLVKCWKELSEESIRAGSDRTARKMAFKGMTKESAMNTISRENASNRSRTGGK